MCDKKTTADNLLLPCCPLAKFRSTITHLVFSFSKRIVLRPAFFPLEQIFELNWRPFVINNTKPLEALRNRSKLSKRTDWPRLRGKTQAVKCIWEEFLPVKLILAKSREISKASSRFNMATRNSDYVLDELLCYLSNPLFQVPVLSFMENNCLSKLGFPCCYFCLYIEIFCVSIAQGGKTMTKNCAANRAAKWGGR